MSVTRVGATKRFADNWEHIFGGPKQKASIKTKSAKSAKKKAAAKKTPSRGKKRSRAGR